LDRAQLRPLLRRRLVGGYQREGVDRALDQMWARVRELEHELETFRESTERLEGVVQAAQSELEDFRAREQAILHAEELARVRKEEIAAAAEDRATARLAQAEETARAREEAAHAAAVLLAAEAESQAEQIRAEAEQQAAAVRAAAEEDAELFRAGLQQEAEQARQDAELRLAEGNRELAGLLRVKDDLLRDIRRLIKELDQVTTRFERGEEPQLAAVTELPVDLPPPLPAAAVPWPDNDAPGEHLFDKRVEIDVGPIGDLGMLSQFERCLAKLPSVSDVYVRRYAEDRAAIEVTLVRPAALLRAMSQSLPYSFDVESLDGDKVRINVVAPLAAAR
jgi:hypothetical protein